VQGKVLVTGAAGFIGFHVCERLLEEGREVVGVDNLCDYYDVSLKERRVDRLVGRDGFSFIKHDLAVRDATADLFESQRPAFVINLAAQVGVRHSLDQPAPYIDSNVVGFLNVLEGCRGKVKHLVYASSSSVYGGNTQMPFSVDHNVDHPLSLYGATKKANELMAHSYSHLYGLPTTGLRFFTVYGPWGRPDMAVFKFTRAILEGDTIDVFNEGQMERDFTYVADVVAAVVALCERPPSGDAAWTSDSPAPGSSSAPYRVHNIGSNRPIGLMTLIETLEDCIGRKAQKRMCPMQPGDLRVTFADTQSLVREVGFSPSTSLRDGLQAFVDWYREYYAESR
jgi:UDP-glucuronate 4-epimerase